MSETDVEIDSQRSWAGRAPVASVVVALGLAFALFAWLGLRSVETKQAEVDYERQLLAEASELQSSLEQALRAVEGMRALLEAEPDPSDVQMGRFLASAGMIREPVVYLEIGVDGSLIVQRALGFAEAEAMVGSDLSQQGDLGSLPAGVSLDGATMVLTGERTAGLFGPPSDAPSLSFVGPVMGPDGADVVGLVASQLVLDDLFALHLEVGGEIIAASDPIDELGEPFGDAVVFTEEETEWSIQGYEAGLDIDRRASTIALVVGLAVAGLGGLVARATRRYAITLGRLERSEYDARHDDLTGLLNRSGLTDMLGEQLTDRRGGDLVGVLFLDLDRLKVVNDSIGHSAGDEVLCAVAERLRSITRDGDVVGRFGGDEFVIVSSGVPAISDLTTLAERVLEVLKEPAVLSDESSQMIAASIGIAYVSKGEATAEDLLRDADLAMYLAKERGGSRYEVFDAELRAQALARLEVERELRRAIRTGQLIVHYQPIVDMVTGGVDRLEALVRWQHPVRGMIPPGAFLSVAAESGLIVDVGEHVLRESCRQAALWSSAVGRPIMVSVNVAERQLIDASLVDTVRRVLAETGIEPSQLELEITEELIVDRLDHRLTVLHELVAMGIKLAIDDFGTSRASLGQLKKLDMVSTLKIDRAFVIDVATDIVDRKIITAIVALADSVGMEVVAEGVEDREQAAVLRQLGVDLIQGFYFQRPAASQQMTTVLNKQFDVPDPANADV